MCARRGALTGVAVGAAVCEEDRVVSVREGVAGRGLGVLPGLPRDAQVISLISFCARVGGLTTGLGGVGLGGFLTGASPNQEEISCPTVFLPFRRTVGVCAKEAGGATGLEGASGGGVGSFARLARCLVDFLNSTCDKSCSSNTALRHHGDSPLAVRQYYYCRLF